MEKYNNLFMDFFKSLCKEYGQGESSMRAIFFEGEHGEKSANPTFVFSYRPQLLVGKKRKLNAVAPFDREKYGAFVRRTPSGSEIYKSLTGVYVKRTQKEQPEFSVKDFIPQERRKGNVLFAFLLFQEEEGTTLAFAVTNTPITSKVPPSFVRALTLKNDGDEMKMLFSKKSVKDKQARILFPNEIKIICNKILAQHTYLLEKRKLLLPLG